MLIMFAEEVQFIWQRPFTGATILLIVNRYTMILLQVPDITISLFSWKDETEEVAQAVRYPPGNWEFPCSPIFVSCQ